MHCDVVVEDLVENPPGLQPPIQSLVTCPYPPLHCPIFRRIHVVPGAFYFVGVAVVGPSSALTRSPSSRKLRKTLLKKFNVSILTRRVGTLDPHQVPREDVDAQLVAKSGLPRVLVGRKGVPLLCKSLLWDSEVGAIDVHCAAVAHIVGTKPALKDDLRLRGAVTAGV